MAPRAFLMLLFATLGAVASASCQPFNPLITPTFAEIIPAGSLVYVPTTFADLENQAFPQQLAFAGIQNSTCKNFYAVYIAKTIFRGCELVGTNPVAIPPCRSLCTQAFAECSDVDLSLLGAFTLGLPPCNSYPISSTMVNVNATSVNVSCAVLEADTVNPHYPTCVNYTGTACQGLTTPQVFIPSGYTIPLLEEQLTTNRTVVGLGMSNECVAAAQALACSTVYMPCDLTTVQTTLSQFLGVSVPPMVIPKFPSLTTCMNLYSSCGITDGDSLPNLQLTDQTNLVKYLMGVNFPYGKCNSTGRAPNWQPNYPANETVFYQNSGVGITITSTVNRLLEKFPVTPACQPFNSSFIRAGMDQNDPLRPPRSYCENMIAEGQLVYVPAPDTLNSLNALAGQVHWLFGLATRGECSLAFAKYVCFQAFNPCTPQNVSNGANPPVVWKLPSLPCQSICQNFQTQCASFIAQNALLVPNCSQTNPIVGSAAFPTQFTALGAIDLPASPTSSPTMFPVLSQCTGEDAWSTQLVEQDVPFVCHAPFVDPREPGNPRVMRKDDLGRQFVWETEDSEGASCQVPCPVSMWPGTTRFEYLPIIWKIICSISFISVLFLFVPWNFFPLLKKQGLTRNLVNSCTGLQVAFCVSAFNGPANTVCANPGQRPMQAYPGSHVCIFQSVLVTYFALAFSYWMVILALDTFIAIKKSTVKGFYGGKYSKALQLTAWGAPVVSLIVIGGTDSFSLPFPIMFCVPSSNVFASVFFYGPVAIGLLFGSTLFWYVIFTLHGHLQKMRVKDRSLIVRPVMLNLCMLTNIFFVLLYRLIEVGEGLVSATEVWVTCTNIQAPQAYFLHGLNQAPCNLVQPDMPAHKGVDGLFHVILPLIGLWVFMVYGWGTRVQNAWRDVLATYIPGISKAHLTGSHSGAQREPSKRVTTNQSARNMSKINGKSMDFDSTAGANVSFKAPSAAEVGLAVMGSSKASSKPQTDRENSLNSTDPDPDQHSNPQ